MARINWEQVRRAAEAVAALPDGIKPLNFYSFFTPDGGEIVASDMYPPLDHPAALDFFAFVMLHNYGFWHGDMKGYAGPLVGNLGGKPRKGSDLLWRIGMRKFAEDPDWFLPVRLANISRSTIIDELFRDDDGPIAFRDLPARATATHLFSRWLVERKMTMRKIVRTANAHTRSLDAFLRLMRVIPGFDRDRLEKRQFLLAMALHNRPERFLEVNDPEHWMPVVDYHLMRVCLRTGMVELEGDEPETNRRRAWVEVGTGNAIRGECFAALKKCQDDSGRSHALNDFAFWKARRSCPEMSEPDCSKCHFNGFCARRTDLFQPVYETTDY